MRKARLSAAYRGPQQEVGEKFGLGHHRPDSAIEPGPHGRTETFERKRLANVWSGAELLSLET